MRTNKKRTAAAALLLAAMGAAQAAGGHHAVDDAQILQRGECEGETWLQRADRGERLLHAGLQCGVGPVELGAAGEYARDSGASQTGWELEAKWAREVADGIHLGVKVGPTWAARVRPRHQGTALVGLATWTPQADWAFHLNFGREFVRGDDGNENRYGAAFEWNIRPAWSVMGERFKQESTHFVRAGLRWEAGRNWSIDFSRAQRLSGPSPSNWTLGLTIGLGDD